MKIFITGATGYIGFAVAKTFRRAGHQVIGLTRNNEKAILLAKEEIVPIIGSLQNPDEFIKVAEQCDIIIHAAVDYNNDTADLDKNMIVRFIDAAKNSAKIKKLIYTSGTWVYGSSEEILTAESEINPIKAVSWRPAIEKLVIDNPYLNGIVIRPGCVYGGHGNMTNDLFDSVINKNSANLIGNGSNRWPMVHVDDLAYAYLLAAEKDVSNTVFNIVEETSASINEIIAGIKRFNNDRVELNFIPLEKAVHQMGNFAEAFAINQKFDTSFAKNTIGWLPKHKGFLKELEIYYSSWKAYQNKNNKNL